MSRGWRPLHLAAEEGHLEVVELLLAAKASVEAEGGEDRRGPWNSGTKGWRAANSVALWRSAKSSAKKLPTAL